MTVNLTIDGKAYRVGKMAVMKQFHVGRRVMPVFAILGITAADLARGKLDVSAEQFMGALMPMATVLSKMTDSESEYVVNECLSCVERVEADGRSQCLVEGGRMMYEDVDLPSMMRLVWEAIAENLGGFTKGLGAALPSPGPSGTEGQTSSP